MYYIKQHFEFSHLYGPSTYVTVLLERPLSNTEVFYDTLHAGKYEITFKKVKKMY